VSRPRDFAVRARGRVKWERVWAVVGIVSTVLWISAMVWAVAELFR
jgi:hypothetical protein